VRKETLQKLYDSIQILKQNLQEHDLEEEFEESGPKIDLQLIVTMTKSITCA
jgi:hypothetical protein